MTAASSVLIQRQVIHVCVCKAVMGDICVTQWVELKTMQLQGELLDNIAMLCIYLVMWLKSSFLSYVDLGSAPTA